MNCTNCNVELKPQKGHSEQKGDYIYYNCQDCSTRGIGKTAKDAEKDFLKNHPQETQIESGQQETQTSIITLAPKSPKDIIKWAQSNMPALMEQSAQFIDKPATRRMIEKNIRYVSGLTCKSWDKIWNTPEGQESISNALAEAHYYASTLPDMGSIVPFGTVAEFIPSVECFEFAMLQGKNSPFDMIQIIPVHENDQRKPELVNGNFDLHLQYGIPRGKIIAVCVMARRSDTGKTIGEIYDVDRLLEKAKHHSPAYRNYIIEKENFQRAKIEGKLKRDQHGREYMETVINKKDGGTWEKKSYEHDITNPYDGPDRPEMLRKAAGKSFFRPYMKVRNATAMADEWKSDETINDDISRNQAADNVLSQAENQFVDKTKIKDAEIVAEKDDIEN